MIDRILNLVAPHHCSGCGILGSLLCDNCKYDIISEPFAACSACGKSLASKTGLCGRCQVPYSRAWCAADRRDQLERLIDSYKFTNAKAASTPLTDILDTHLPELPENTVVIPVPTASSHIRQRGYDHMRLVTKQLAKRRGLVHDTSLRRITDTKQRGANARQRVKQAKAAFHCASSLDPGKIYLLVDDVVTTGATMKYAAQALIDAGAVTVWTASISRQTLD